jgi:hypothetical protein
MRREDFEMDLDRAASIAALFATSVIFLFRWENIPEILHNRQKS